MSTAGWIIVAWVSLAVILVLWMWAASRPLRVVRKDVDHATRTRWRDLRDQAIGIPVLRTLCMIRGHVLPKTPLHPHGYPVDGERCMRCRKFMSNDELALVVGNREQGIGNGERGTGNREDRRGGRTGDGR